MVAAAGSLWGSGGLRAGGEHLLTGHATLDVNITVRDAPVPCLLCVVNVLIAQKCLNNSSMFTQHEWAAMGTFFYILPMAPGGLICGS